jgi:hypothetical protein
MEGRGTRQQTVAVVLTKSVVVEQVLLAEEVKAVGVGCHLQEREEEEVASRLVAGWGDIRGDGE